MTTEHHRQERRLTTTLTTVLLILGLTAPLAAIGALDFARGLGESQGGDPSRITWATEPIVTLLLAIDVAVAAVCAAALVLRLASSRTSETERRGRPLVWLAVAVLSAAALVTLSGLAAAATLNDEGLPFFLWFVLLAVLAAVALRAGQGATARRNSRTSS
jgi:hypothetical protein